MKNKEGTITGPDVALAFRQHGVRLTPQRLSIWQELTRKRTHPGAEEVYAAVRRRLPTVSLDTIYRALHLFSSLGLIEQIGSDRQRVRFDTDMTPHHHFVCERCGAIHDVGSAVEDQLEIPPTLACCGRVDRVQIEFRGVCRECLKTEGIHKFKSE